LTVTDKGVSHVGCFFDTALFAQFGLPEVMKSSDREGRAPR
jgi:hypothetical protein